MLTPEDFSGTEHTFCEDCLAPASFDGAAWRHADTGIVSSEEHSEGAVITKLDWETEDN